MKPLINLLFEARKLKHIPRSGYQFLEAGKETVAEHCFLATFIGYIMARMNPEVDADRVIRLCLLHDLPESRIGDLNYVQKRYLAADEARAMEDAASNVPFGGEITALLAEFNAAETPEAELARDADQIAFILDLKALIDSGNVNAEKWMRHVAGRLRTQTAKELCNAIADTDSDAWWRTFVG
ncbi:MAG: HD domain-containing protein [Desulfobacterales bacterium]